MGGILSIGSSALTTAQAALDTVAHNISNVNTAGYSRQQVVQASAFANGTGNGFFGQGVQITTVQRVYSDYLVRQSYEAQASSSSAEAYYQQLSQLDNLLGDSSVGLSPELASFFSAANQVANAPASTAARQSMLSASQALVTRFDQLQTRFDEVRSNLTRQAQASIAEINSAAKEVARLNDVISLAEGQANGQPANDLRDQRDELVRQINEQIKTTVVRQNDGSYNLFIGSGQALVLGNQVATVSMQPDVGDPSRFSIGFSLSGTTQTLPSEFVTGGTLGGLIAFRNGSLDTAQNVLGRIALGFAASMNEQHRLGVDAYGNSGGDLFTYDLPDGIPHADNTGTGVVGLSVSDPSAITSSDYRLDYDGSTYTLTRLSDNTTTSSASLPLTVDGLDFSLASGSPAAGDSYLFRPTADVAGSLALAFSDPLKLAAATPVRTEAATTNLGTASIGAASIDSDFLASPLASPYTLTFNGGALSGFPASYPITAEVAGVVTTYPAASSVPYSDGMKLTVGGVSYTFTGAPSNGDTFTVSPGSGAADNRNMLALANLQTTKLFGGSTTLDDAYGQLVSRIGTETRTAQVSQQAQAKLLEQATTARESVSGVNLDEEAAKMLKYQQSYQAAGKLMQIANDMFNTLLQLGG